MNVPGTWSSVETAVAVAVACNGNRKLGKMRNDVGSGRQQANVEVRFRNDVVELSWVDYKASKSVVVID